jgi:hypothetical protein
MLHAMSRRSFCKALAITAATTRASGQSRIASTGVPFEWSYISGKQYTDPFNQIDLDVVVVTPSGSEERVPAFWAGGSTWRVRYAAQATGTYKFRTICNDTSNGDLHGQSGSLQAETYTGRNPNFKNGVLRIAADRRHFEYADGTPFFWLGDTWWMGLCKRLRWPDDFQNLAADRVRKGFTVVQIVAGLYPDMEPYDPRGANEAGYPWEQDFSRINPAYFDMADIRMQYIAESGLAVCVVGCWGYFLPRMGVAKIKKHWRYLIARWSAYPVVWCLAGEATMPYYLSKTKEQDAEMQKHGWTEVARYVRATDPYHHPITLHPSRSARDCVDDASVIDFDMLQTGHDDRKSAPNTIETIQRSLAGSPKMPVLVGEVCYEGIQEASRQEVQRFMFWASVLSGTAGHTYGANGIWQVNMPLAPYGLSPHGHSWGGPPWDVASQLPGSGQLGLGKALLLRYSWWKLEPHPDLIAPHWTKDDYWQPYAAVIPGEVVIAYYPSAWKAASFNSLETGFYRAFFFNPSDATEQEIGTFKPDAERKWTAPEFPIFRDWIVVLELKKA